MIGEFFARAVSAISYLIEMGGLVMSIHLCMSVVVIAVLIYKLWQQAYLGVGRYRSLRDAIALWDKGDGQAALQRLEGARSHLAPLLGAGIAARMAEGDEGTHDLDARLSSEAETRMIRVESWYRLIDLIAQSAPLLGLLGTVYGMVLAFQAMQSTGGAVDPATLAGGIWVALLTTMSGLSIALPATAILAFFDGRAARERVMAEQVIQAAVRPGLGLLRGLDEARDHAA